MMDAFAREPFAAREAVQHPAVAAAVTICAIREERRRLTLLARALRPASPVHPRNRSAAPLPGRVQGAVRVPPVREAPQGISATGRSLGHRQGNARRASLAYGSPTFANWTRCPGRPSGYSGCDTQRLSRMIDFIRLAKASIANGLPSKCIPGSREPLPIATFSV